MVIRSACSHCSPSHWLSPPPSHWLSHPFRHTGYLLPPTPTRYTLAVSSIRHTGCHTHPSHWLSHPSATLAGTPPVTLEITHPSHCLSLPPVALVVIPRHTDCHPPSSTPFRAVTPEGRRACAKAALCVMTPSVSVLRTATSTPHAAGVHTPEGGRGGGWYAGDRLAQLARRQGVGRRA